MVSKKKLTAIIQSSELNPSWKKYTLIIAQGKQKGQIVIDQITMLQAKSLQQIIEKKGLPNGFKKK